MIAFIEFVLFFANKIFMATSKIPRQPYYHDLTILNEAILIKMNFETIRNEVKGIYRDFKNINNDLFFTGLGMSKTDWTRLYLKWFKKIDPIGAKLCPQTIDIIKSMPNIQTAMIPILNIVLTTKGLIGGAVDYSLLAISFTVMFVLASIAVTISFKQFGKESNVMS